MKGYAHPDAHAATLGEQGSNQVLPYKSAAAGNERLRHEIWPTFYPASDRPMQLFGGVGCDNFCKTAARSGRKPRATKSLAK
jgi:hypothetical protein